MRHWSPWMGLLLVSLGLTAASVLSACGEDGNRADADVGTLSIEILQPTAGRTFFVGEAVIWQAELLLDDAFDPVFQSVQWQWDFGDGTVLAGEADTVVHTWRQPGTFPVTLRALAQPGRGPALQASLATSITVQAPADLLVSAPLLSASTSTLSGTDPFRVTLDVFNQGAGLGVSFDVGVYVATAADLPAGTEPDPDAIRGLLQAGRLLEVTRRTVPGLDTQGQFNLDAAGLTMPVAASAGTFVVVAVADPDQRVQDANRANNARVSARTFEYIGPAGDGPDLIGRDVIVRPARTNALSSIRLEGEIANVGRTPALGLDYVIALSRDRLFDDDDRLLAQGSLDSLSPGFPLRFQDVTLAVDPPATELGEYFVLLVADPDARIADVNRANNVGVSNRIIVTDEPLPGIDIAVRAFDLQPRTTFINGTVEVTATVANEGTEDLNQQFFCRVYLSADDQLDSTSSGDRVLTTLFVEPLAAGAAAELSTLARVQAFFPEGDYTAFVFCDPSQTIAEADEDNNVARAEGVVTVAGDAEVDLRPGRFSVTPLTVDNGALVTVTIEVCNGGSTGAAPSVVRVLRTPDPTFDRNAPVLLQSRVPAVAPGACVTIQADVPAECSTFVADYRLFAQVDATGEIPEVNEDNNVVLLNEGFTISGALCSCELDRFEPNNTISQAAVLSATSRTWEGLTMCQAAIDWYRIPLLRNESLRIVARFDNARGNLDLTLFAPNRATILSSSETDADFEEVSFLVAPNAGDYFLRVQGRTPDDRNLYNLEVSVTPRQPGTDLVPVGARVTPAAVVPGQTVQFTFDLVNLGDQPAGAFLNRFYLSRDTILDPTRDALLGELALPGLEDRLNRQVSLTLPTDIASGTWYVGVVADIRDEVTELNEGNNQAVAALRVNADCFDVLEPNDTLDTARRIDLLTAPPVRLSDLLVCSDNRDFYEVCVPDGNFLTLRADFDPRDGDLDLRLYDELGATVARSETTGAFEQVGVDFVSGDRCYRLEVYVAGANRRVPYSLSIDTGRAPDSLACSRIEEPNNNFASAVPLRNFFGADLAVCPLDDGDFFLLPLTAGTSPRFRLIPAAGQTDVPAQLRLAVFNPSRAFVTGAVSATEELRPAIAVSGNWFLRVRSNGAGPRNQPYRILIEGVPGVDLIPTDLVLEPSSGGPGDTIRFSFTVANARDLASPAANYAVYLSEDTLLSDDDVLLRELPLPAIPGFGSLVEGRRFDIPTDLIDGGLFQVLVFVDNRNTIVEFNERNNVLARELVVTPRCVPDAAEPNDFPFEATPVTAVQGAELTSCGDPDWYTHIAPTAGRYRATLTFTHAQGDLDLAAYRNPTQAPIALSDSITDNEVVEFEASASQATLLLVTSFARETNRYTLQVERLP